MPRATEKSTALSGSSTEMVRGWLKNCTNEHQCVPSQYSQVGGSFVLPTGVLDLGGSSSDTWSLADTSNEMNKYAKYIALSYSPTEDDPYLRQENADKLRDPQPDHVLSRSYQDILSLCRALNVRYLWVKSACFTQISKQINDLEIMEIAEIFSNAFVTLRVCWSKPGLGLFPERRLGTLPSRISEGPGTPIDEITGGDCNDFRYACVTDDSEWSYAVQSATTTKDDWALQCSIFSPRVIYLGNEQLYWECDKIRASENWSTEKSCARTNTHRFDLATEPKRMLANWRDLVNQYSLGLSVDSEINLSGLAAVAQVIAARTGDEYLAGLWKRQLLTDLLWALPVKPKIAGLDLPGSTVSGGKTRVVNPNAPSWTWISSTQAVAWGRLPDMSNFPLRAVLPTPLETHTEEHDCDIESFQTSRRKPLAKLESSRVVAENGNRFSNIESASIELRGLLARLEFAVEGVYRPKQVLKVASRLSQFGNEFLESRKEGFPNGDVGGFREQLRIAQSPQIDIQFSRPIDPGLPCFILPLVETNTSPWPGNPDKHIEGLVLQPQSQIEPVGQPLLAGNLSLPFVRIGSFNAPKAHPYLMDALLENLPSSLSDEGDGGKDDTLEWMLRKHAESSLQSRIEKGQPRPLVKAAEVSWRCVRII